MTSFSVFTPTRTDQPEMAALLGAIALFPPEMLEPLMAPALDGAAPDLWQCARQADRLVGFCFAEPEPLTEGTWNMRALGVHPDAHRQGCGAALTEGLETGLRGTGARLILADTSSAPEFVGARAFYAARGYTQEARIRDFWDAGDDKITFCKALTAP